MSAGTIKTPSSVPVLVWLSRVCRGDLRGSSSFLLACLFLSSALLVGPLAASADADPVVPGSIDPAAHPVVIGIPDTGINPYHEMYHRPGLTAHPSTYIDGYPADVPALPLSVGGSDWQTMFDADRASWEGIMEDTWYWIPETVFVAVYCEAGQRDSHRGEYCILDDGHTHGTGTTSSALMENPGALFAFKAGGSSVDAFFTGGIPVDLFSVSWGNIVPIPGHPQLLCPNHGHAPLYVVGSGNDPRSTWIDCWKGDPRLVAVGGGYPGERDEVMSAKQSDVVSYFCRPVAQTRAVSGLTSSCGTSFAAPTVAGGLSKVIQAVRADSGYSGMRVGDTLDPVAGFTIHDLREAMNQTASYDPEDPYGARSFFGLPLNPVAPWLQWGWGFYDGLVADHTIAHLLAQPAPEKPLGAVAYMTASHTMKTALYGDTLFAWPFVQNDAQSGDDAPNHMVPEVIISPGVVYQGTVNGFGDTRDFYAFWAEAGAEIHLEGRGGVNQFALLDHDGRVLGSATTTTASPLTGDGGIRATAETTGTHYVRAYGLHPVQYAFALGLDQDAPEPGFSGLPLPPVPPVG